jgi:hypothetical protein
MAISFCNSEALIRGTLGQGIAVDQRERAMVAHQAAMTQTVQPRRFWPARARSAYAPIAASTADI